MPIITKPIDANETAPGETQAGLSPESEMQDEPNPFAGMSFDECAELLTKSLTRDAAERDRLLAVNAELVEALEGAEEWLSGWASAEPYLSSIRAALARAKGE